MFRFADPNYLYLLIAIPLLALVWYLSALALKKRRRRLADDDLLTRMVPNYSSKRQLFKFVLLTLAVACLAVMLARPQFGMTSATNDKKGIEAAFIIDVSNSMLAQDVQPNRLERSKLLVSTLIDRMKNDRVAIGVFAGEAYPQLPITNDYASAKLFLDNFMPCMVTLQGTSVASAINLGRVSFTDKEDIGKAIIVITDGEDHEEGAIEAAKKAAEEGFKVFVLGVGSTGGARIPLSDGSYLRDREGKEVNTALNEKMCIEVAEAGGGTYFHVDNSNEAQQLLQDELDKLQQADNSVSFSERDEQFQAMALLALILIVIELFVLETKNPLLKRLRLFKR
ncbi:MAG: VWA domain-containing protein [Bacteroidales bacterium]|nr:VWA domain-containing protein [Bacteroidales bacterium]